MSAMRVPKVAELKDVPLIGPIIASLFETLGIEDADLPDLIPDDLDYDDHDALARCFPNLAAKLGGLEP